MRREGPKAHMAGRRVKHVIEKTRRGHPKVNVSQDTLVNFRSLGFKWKYIADIFLASR